MTAEKFCAELCAAPIHELDAGWELRLEDLPLWGKKVFCRVRCLDGASPDGDDVSSASHSVDREAIVREFKRFLPKLKKCVMPPAGNIFGKNSQYFDHIKFKSITHKLQGVLRESGLSAWQHCDAAMPFAAELELFLNAIDLPEELLRDDNPLYYALAILNAQAHGLRSAVEGGTRRPNGIEALDSYIAAIERLIDLMDENSARLRGLPRPMTPEEYAEVAGLEARLNDSGTPLERRAQICRELLEVPLAAAEDKIEYVTTIIDAAKKTNMDDAVRQEEPPTGRDNAAPAREFLRKAAEKLVRLDADGPDALTQKIAARMLKCYEKEGGTNRENMINMVEQAPATGDIVAALVAESVTVNFAPYKKAEVTVCFAEDKGWFDGEAVAVKAADGRPAVAAMPRVTFRPARSLGREYARKVKRAARLRGIDDLAPAFGAAKSDIAKLKTVFPDAPQSLLDLLAELDGTYYRDYGAQKVTVPVFNGVLPYYLNSVRQILGDDLYAAPAPIDLRPVTPVNAAETDAPEGSIAYYYESDDLDETAGPGIDPHQPLWRMLHVSNCINNGGSSQLYIDFHPAQGGVKGQVVRFVHDPDEYSVIAPCFDAFLLNCIEEGFGFFDSEAW